MAIAYTFAEENGKLSLLRKNPPEPKTFIPNFKDENPKQDPNILLNQDNSLIKSSEPIIKQQEVDTFQPIDIPIENLQSLEHQTINEKNLEKVNEEPHKEIEENISNQVETDLKVDEEESDDDNEGWINPDNFSQHFFTSQKVDEKDNTLGIAIMTSDFAMQVFNRNEKKYLF